MTAGSHFPRFSSSPLISWHYTWLMNPPFGWCLMLGACQNPRRIHSCWQQYQFFPHISTLSQLDISLPKPISDSHKKQHSVFLSIKIHKTSSSMNKKNIYIPFPALIWNIRFWFPPQNSTGESMKAWSFPPLLWVSRQPQPFNVFFIVKQYLMFHYGPSSVGLACLDTTVMLSGLMKWVWMCKRTS